MSVPGQEATQTPDPAGTAGTVPGAPAHRRQERGDVLPLLLVAALTLIGVAVRLIVAHQSLFADELSTY